MVWGLPSIILNFHPRYYRVRAESESESEARNVLLANYSVLTTQYQLLKQRHLITRPVTIFTSTLAIHDIKSLSYRVITILFESIPDAVVKTALYSPSLSLSTENLI